MTQEPKPTRSLTHPKDSVVERAYQEAINRMTGQERVARTCQLYESIHRMLSHKVRRKNPNLTDKQVQLRVARILYASDPQTQKLIDMAEKL